MMDEDVLDVDDDDDDEDVYDGGDGWTDNDLILVVLFFCSI